MHPARIRANLGASPEGPEGRAIDRPRHLLHRAATAAACLLTTFCVTLAAPAAMAATAGELFADGNRLFRENLYWAALLRYRQAGEAGLDSPLLHYNTGVAHYRAGQYRRAREAFGRAAAEPRLAGRAQYNLGLTELAAGNPGEAGRLFREVAGRQQEPRLAVLAEHALARLPRRSVAVAGNDAEPAGPEATDTAPRPFGNFEARATIGVGNDDNVFASGAAAYNDLSQPGAPLVEPEIRSGVYYPFDVVAKYSVNSFEHESFFGSYRATGRYYADPELENATEYSQQLAFGTEYQRRREDRERKIFSAFTIAQHDETWYDRDDGVERELDGATVGERMSYVRYGPELTFRQSFSRLSFNLRALGQIWNYENTEALPEYDHEYLHGGVSVQYRFTSTSLVRVTADAWQRRFGERPSFDLDGTQPIENPAVRYHYTKYGATARQRITRAMWFGLNYARTTRIDRHVGYNDYIRDGYGAEFSLRAGERFRLHASATYRIYGYTNAYAYNDPAGGRKTLETADGLLTAEWRITDRLSLTGEYLYRDVVSNDARIAYERGRYMLGLHWVQ